MRSNGDASSNNNKIYTANIRDVLRLVNREGSSLLGLKTITKLMLADHRHTYIIVYIIRHAHVYYSDNSGDDSEDDSFRRTASESLDLIIITIVVD